MTATEGFEKIKRLVDQGCDKVIVCNGGSYQDLEYGGTTINSSHLLSIARDLLMEKGQLGVEYKIPSTVVLKVVATPVVCDMLVMSIDRRNETIVINVKERADG